MTLLNKSIFLLVTLCYILFCGLKNNTLQVFLDNIIVQKKVFVNADEPILVSDSSIDLFESYRRNYSENNVENVVIEFDRKERFDYIGLIHIGKFVKHKTPPPEALSCSR